LRTFDLLTRGHLPPEAEWFVKVLDPKSYANKLLVGLPSQKKFRPTNNALERHVECCLQQPLFNSMSIDLNDRSWQPSTLLQGLGSLVDLKQGVQEL